MVKILARETGLLFFRFKNISLNVQEVINMYNEKEVDAFIREQEEKEQFINNFIESEDTDEVKKQRKQNIKLIEKLIGGN